MKIKRPYLIHFSAIQNNQYLTIRAGLGITPDFPSVTPQLPLTLRSPHRPIQGLGQIRNHEFCLKILAYDEEGREVLNQEEHSDRRGQFLIRIKCSPQIKMLKKVTLYETLFYQRTELLLGHFIPLAIPSPLNLVISDFDKTLVDTQYASAKDLFKSLTSPLNSYPPLEGGLKIFKDAIQNNAIPFILSASPHFYEMAIRDWLYQQEIFGAEIFLKDYRKIFSIFNLDLTPKDIKTHGFYKLHSLLTIIYMTGIPEKMTLMGDAFESDALVYCTLIYIFSEEFEETELLRLFQIESSFKTTPIQLKELRLMIKELRILSAENKITPDVKIFIRSTAKQSLKKNLGLPPLFEILQSAMEKIETYMN